MHLEQNHVLCSTFQLAKYSQIVRHLCECCRIGSVYVEFCDGGHIIISIFDAYSFVIKWCNMEVRYGGWRMKAARGWGLTFIITTITKIGAFQSRIRLWESRTNYRQIYLNCCLEWNGVCACRYKVVMWRVSGVRNWGTTPSLPYPAYHNIFQVRKVKIRKRGTHSELIFSRKTIICYG